MTTEQQVIWQSFLMRRDRDLERLWILSEAGDPISRKFFSGLGEWLEKCRSPAGKTPLCLACEHTFCDPAQPPLTYLMTYSEDSRIESDLLILTGVCRRCAERSDAELLKRGADCTAKFLKGRALGWAVSGLCKGEQ